MQLHHACIDVNMMGRALAAPTARCDAGRALTEMQHDVRETQEALQECMDNPATLSGICLTEAQNPKTQVKFTQHQGLT